MGDIKQEQKRARHWVRTLGPDQIFALVDALVLGDFDWREWLDTQPTKVFVSAAFTEAQHREELEIGY